MGVKGLWQLLLPIGRRISLETLEGQTLAVDASIWLTQMLKAMRNKETGRVQPAAHLVGFIRRICRLYFHGIRPVFVFDGPTPAIKLRETAERRKKREAFGKLDQSAVQKLARRLLASNLKSNKSLKKMAESSPSKKQNQSAGHNGKKSAAYAPGFIAPPEEGASQNNDKGETSDTTGTSVATAIVIGEADQIDQPDKEKATADSGFVDENEAAIIASIEEDLLDAEAKKNENQRESDFDIPIASRDAPGDAETTPQEEEKSKDKQGLKKYFNTSRRKKIGNSIVDCDDVEQISALPSSERKDAIEEAKRQQRLRSRREYMPAAANPDQFSSVQLTNFLKSSRFNLDVQKMATEKASSSTEPQSSRKRGRIEENVVMASDRTTRISLIRDNGESKPSNKRVAYEHNAKSSLNKRTKVPSSKEKPSRRDETIDFDKEEGGGGFLVDSDVQGDRSPFEEIEEATDRGETNEDDIAPARSSNINPHLIVLQDESSDESDDNEIVESDPVAKPEIVVLDDVSEEQDRALALALQEIEDAKAAKNLSRQALESDASDSDDVVWMDGDAENAQAGPLQEKIDEMGEDRKPAAKNSEGKPPSEDHDESQEGDTVFNDQKPQTKALQSESGIRATVPSELLDIKGNNSSDDEDVEWEDGEGDIDQRPHPPVDQRQTAGQREEENTLKPAWVLNNTKDRMPSDDEDVEWGEGEGESPTIDQKQTRGQQSDTEQNKAPVDLKDAGSSLVEKDGNSGNPFEDASKAESTKFSSDSSKNVRFSSESTSEISQLLTSESSHGSMLRNTFEDSTKNAGSWGVTDSRSAETAAVLERAQATASSLADWAGRAFKRAMKDVNKSSDPPARNQDEQENSQLDGSNDKSIEATSHPTVNVHSYRKEPRNRSWQNTRKASPVGDKEQAGNESTEPIGVPLEMTDEVLLQWERERNQRERDADTVTDDMKDEAIQLLKLFGVPYVEAPAEAEAQCVALEALGLVDGVVTEDSDVFVFGGKRVFKNIFDEKQYAELYTAEDAEKEMGLNDNAMVALAMLLGSDYTAGVRGVGVVNAMEVLQAFEVSSDIKGGLSRFASWLDGFDPKESILKPGVSQHSNAEESFREMHKSARTRWIMPPNFPADAVIQAYVNPVVDKSNERFTWGHPDVESLVIFCAKHIGWPAEETRKMLEPVVSRKRTKYTQTRLDRFIRYEDGFKFAEVRSKRLRTVLGIEANKQEPKRNKKTVASDTVTREKNTKSPPMRSAPSENNSKRSKQSEPKAKARQKTKTKTSKDKATNSLPQPPPGWDRCHVYLHQKHRFCRQQPLASCPQRYCGNHQHLLQQTLTPDGEGTFDNKHGKGGAKKVRRRIRCPVDPTHWINEEDLDKHILICPKTKQINEEKGLPYYCQDCNAGGYGISGRDVVTGSLSLEQAKRLASAILETHQRLFSDKPPLKDIRELTVADIENALDMEDYSVESTLPQSTSKDWFESIDTTSNQIRFGTAKHVRQQTSLLGHLQRGCMSVSGQGESRNASSDVCTIVECGAGLGMTGLLISGVLAAREAQSDSSKAPTAQTQLLLVERTGSRGKADKVLRNFGQGGQGKGVSKDFRPDLVEWKRAACDLQHLDLDKALKTSFPDQVDAYDANHVVHVLGKHVCGVGTDLSLKALEPLTARERNPKLLQSCIMATCCHGVCSWKDYVGRDWLREALVESSAYAKFGPAEFECMRKWCAASVATSEPLPTQENTLNVSTAPSGRTPTQHGNMQGAASDIEEHTTDFGSDSARKDIVSVAAVVQSLGIKCGMAGLGRACQRLFDYGRQQYMKRILGFDKTKLIHYVPSEVSPQNALLVGYRSNKIHVNSKNRADVPSKSTAKPIHSRTAARPKLSDLLTSARNTEEVVNPNVQSTFATRKSTTHKSDPTEPATPSGDDDLPSAWTKHWSAAKKKHYYYNTETNQSCWQWPPPPE